jgi:c(7)-type cytochrome triheme protein
MQNKIKTFGAVLLAGSFFLATHSTPSLFAATISKDGASVSNSTAAKGDNRKFLYDEQTGKTYGPKAPVVWEKPTKVAFDHKFHTKEAGLSCSSCHNSLFTMKTGSILSTGKMTMAAMAEGKFCGTCHDGSTAFATNTKCSACHTNLSEIIPADPVVWTHPVKSVVFSHKTHIGDLGLECESCHDGLFAMQKGAAEKADNFTMQSLYDGKYCGACHDGKTAFASNTRCNTCHIGVKGHNRLTGNDGAHEQHQEKTQKGH